MERVCLPHEKENSSLNVFIFMFVVFVNALLSFLITFFFFLFIEKNSKAENVEEESESSEGTEDSSDEGNLRIVADEDNPRKRKTSLQERWRKKL